MVVWGQPHVASAWMPKAAWRLWQRVLIDLISVYVPIALHDVHTSKAEGLHCYHVFILHTCRGSMSHHPLPGHEVGHIGPQHLQGSACSPVLHTLAQARHISVLARCSTQR